MKCLRCQHENPAGATFCDECGARLDAARRLGNRSAEFSPRHHGFAAHAQHSLGDIATRPARAEAKALV